VTLVIIREDLIGQSLSVCPAILDYKVQANANSLYNTPPCYSIYMLGLVVQWIESIGGIIAITKRNLIKSQMLYAVVENSNGFYKCAVKKGHRSRMNVTFRISDGDKDLETAFIEQSKAVGMNGLKGHRSVGGIRASLYNAITVEEVGKLVKFMKEFQDESEYSATR